MKLTAYLYGPGPKFIGMPAQANLRKRPDGPKLEVGAKEQLPIYNKWNAQLLHDYFAEVRLPQNQVDRRRAIIHLAPIIAELWDATFTPLELDDHE